MNKRTKQLLRENNALDQQLTAENDRILTDIVCYLRGTNICEYRQELIRRDLLEMVLAGQARGESARTVIGEDYRAFCDEIIAGVPVLNKGMRILSFLDILFLALTIAIAITVVLSPEMLDFFGNLLAGTVLSATFPFTAGRLLSIAVITGMAILIVRWVTKTALQTGKKGGTVRSFLLWAGLMIVFLLLARLGRDVLFIVNFLAVIGIILAFYLLHRMFAALVDRAE